MRDVRKCFCMSAGLILSITGAAKVWSAFGNAELLRRMDPICNIQFAHLMLFVGLFELVLAGLCLFSKSNAISITLVAFLSGSLLVYRFGLWWIGWHRACSCLGNLTDALHISPQAADTAMKVVLAYLLIGSYSTMLWFWRQNQKARPTTPALEATASER